MRHTPPMQLTHILRALRAVMMRDMAKFVQ